MVICITKFFQSNYLPLRNLSGSVAEHGQLAGEITWRNSCALGASLQLLDTPEKVEAFRAFLEATGFEPSESEDWEGLFIQVIAGDLRQMGCEIVEDLSRPEVLEAQERGDAPSNILVGLDGEVYFCE